MTKTEAIALLGGTPAAAAREIGIKPPAINQWPEVLPPRIEDRVLAALFRRQHRANAAMAAVLAGR